MSDMDAYTGSTKCTQSFDYANEVRSTIDWLDFAVDRKITDVWFPRRRGLTNSFPSSPELTTDSPVYHSVVIITSPPVQSAVLVTAEIDVDAETLKCLQRHGSSLIDSLDLAVDQRISAVGLRSLPLREHAVSFRSSVELSVHSPVYGTANTVPSVVAEILPNLARLLEYSDQIFKVKESKIILNTKGLKKSVKDYRMVRKYEILMVNGKERLINTEKEITLREAAGFSSVTGSQGYNGVIFSSMTVTYIKLAELTGTWRRESGAPTTAINDDKDFFYDNLERVYDMIPRSYIRILVGDQNAQVGRLVISSTQFQRKEIYKQTWVSPDGRTKSQINHILIDKRYRSSVRLVRSYRGADGDTDHYLVISSFRTKLANSWKQKRLKGRTRLEIENTKDREKVKSYRGILNNELMKTFQNTEQNLEETWNIVKDSINKSAEVFKKENTFNGKNSWFNERCKEAIERRAEARLKMIQDPSPDNIEEFVKNKKAASKILRQEKRQAGKGLIQKIEEHRLNPRLFFKKCRSIKEGFKAQTRMVKDNDGKLITNEEGIIQKFQAHFKNILNVDQGVREEIVDTVYHTAQPLVEEPNHKEVKDIIATLKNNKAPGEDNINSELLKIGTQQLVTKIHGLLKQIWNTNRIPEDWKTAVICPIYKKGDPMDTSNYRGIALLDSCYKILSLALLRRLEVYSKDLIGDYQSGFVRGKSTSNHIFTIRQMREKFYEFGKDVHMCFVDFKQAYDSIVRNKLWATLEEFGIPKKLIDLIKACNTNTMCKVKFGNGTSDRFEVSTGLKQDDALSPVLFNLALEKVIRSMPMRQNMELLSNSTLLAYADVIVI
ncbi:hypothetical protein QTP88_024427 [Uroleucon formosanum]